jgi:hypothetical protein
MVTSFPNGLTRFLGRRRFVSTLRHADGAPQLEPFPQGIRLLREVGGGSLRKAEQEPGQEKDDDKRSRETLQTPLPLGTLAGPPARQLIIPQSRRRSAIDSRRPLKPGARA